jgi:hypothetical protein
VLLYCRGRQSVLAPQEKAKGVWRLRAAHCSVQDRRLRAQLLAFAVEAVPDAVAPSATGACLLRAAGLDHRYLRLSHSLIGTPRYELTADPPPAAGKGRRAYVFGFECVRD